MQENVSFTNQGIYGSEVVNEVVKIVTERNEINIDVSNSNVSNSNIINSITISLSKSLEFNELIEKQKLLEETLKLTPLDNEARRFELQVKINHQKEFIKKYTQDVLILANQFNQIEINTEILSRAKEYFDEGKFTEARVLLKEHDEQSEKDETVLWTKDEDYKKNTQPALIAISQQRLIQAIFEQTNYENPNWFEDTCNYFERSIKSDSNRHNNFLFGSFLQDNNQFDEAEKYFQIYLEEYADDAEDWEKAGLFNNLGSLNFDKGKREKAETLYLESLEIWRKLAKENPSQYLICIVDLLNNLGELYLAQGKFELSKKHYKEALKVSRKLSKENHLKYSGDVASTLNNLGNANLADGNSDEAFDNYIEALKILEEYDENTLKTYVEDKADILNNIGLALIIKENLFEALQFLLRALQLREKLAEIEPSKFLPDVAQSHYKMGEIGIGLLPDEIALNHLAKALEIYDSLTRKYPNVYVSSLAKVFHLIAVTYQQYIPIREKSIDSAVTAIRLLLPIYQDAPENQQRLESALNVLTNWSLNATEIQNLIYEERK